MRMSNELMESELKVQRQLDREVRFTKPDTGAVVNPISSQTAALARSVMSGVFAMPERLNFQNAGSVLLQQTASLESYRQIFFEMQAAQRAIEAKAGELGWAGNVVADFAAAGDDGYVIRYEHADIYYSPRTGAQEVHGDIRAKYNALGVASGVLGLPTISEQMTPDKLGRYNHFQNGSIYWTQQTGPMMLRGAIRDFWAASSWERGIFGYPVSDQHRKAIAHSTDYPAENSTVFQNGAIYSKGGAAAAALVAEIQPQQLTDLVRKTFDKALKDADGNLGIEGGVNVLNVSDWGYGFWASQKRTITYEINGFYSLNDVLPIPTFVLPDPTFRLELQFQFDLTSEASLTEPTDKTLVIYLKRGEISTSGFKHGSLNDKLSDGIRNTFPHQVGIIPAAALLIDILVTPQGGLQFLLEPDTEDPEIGNVRRYIFQQQLDSLLEE